MIWATEGRTITRVVQPEARASHESWPRTSGRTMKTSGPGQGLERRRVYRRASPLQSNGRRSPAELARHLAPPEGERGDHVADEPPPATPPPSPLLHAERPLLPQPRTTAELQGGSLMLASPRCRRGTEDEYRRGEPVAVVPFVGRLCFTELLAPPPATAKPFATARRCYYRKEKRRDLPLPPPLTVGDIRCRRMELLAGVLHCSRPVDDLRQRDERCDRILSYGKGMRLLSYRRSELQLSDHRPVTATYMVEVDVFSARKLQRAGLSPTLMQRLKMRKSLQIILFYDES
nr:type IV inositol polyphosphate 5-phosphatase 3-like isoform X1 [Ipomoea batatas]